MPWYTFQLTSAQEAAGEGTKALNIFEQLYTRLGGPPEVAMFFAEVPGQNRGTYYLTPATEQRAPGLIRLLQAAPGVAPPANATLMAGVNGKRPSDF
jgi:hypothetical protein